MHTQDTCTLLLGDPFGHYREEALLLYSKFSSFPITRMLTCFYTTNSPLLPSTRSSASPLAQPPRGNAETLGDHRRATEAKVHELAGRVREMESQLAQVRGAFKVFTTDVNQQMAAILQVVRTMNGRA